MSKSWATPVDVQYKVNFYSGGDTTRDAFSKHIQEITRIYGLLNALDSAKVSASDVSGLTSSLSSTISGLTSSLTAHINSSNPHPNYHPSWNDLTNKPSLSDLSGNLDADRINGLTSKIASQLPAPSGDGIMSYGLPPSGGHNGYALFKNGLAIVWGQHTLNRASWSEANAIQVTFSQAFSDTCYTVVAGTGVDVPDSDNGSVDCMVQVKNITKTGFKYIVQQFHAEESNNWTKLHCNYIAIGK